MKNGSILKIVLGADTGLLNRVTNYLAVDKIEQIRRRVVTVKVPNVPEEGGVQLEEVFDIFLESGKEIRVESKHDPEAFAQIEESLEWLMDPSEPNEDSVQPDANEWLRG